MNSELSQIIQSLLDSESNEGCSDDLTVVSSEPIAKLRELMEQRNLYAKRDSSGPYEDHRREVDNMGAGKMWVVRWSCDFETRIKLDPDSTEQDARDMACELDIPEGTAVYVDETFDIREIETEADYKEKYG